LKDALKLFEMMLHEQLFQEFKSFMLKNALILYSD
jgi:hypothetical protein